MKPVDLIAKAWVVLGTMMACSGPICLLALNMDLGPPGEASSYLLLWLWLEIPLGIMLVLAAFGIHKGWRRAQKLLRITCVFLLACSCIFIINRVMQDTSATPTETVAVPPLVFELVTPAIIAVLSLATILVLRSNTHALPLAKMNNEGER
jgi:hypothetical protein